MLCEGTRYGPHYWFAHLLGALPFAAGDRTGCYEKMYLYSTMCAPVALYVSVQQFLINLTIESEHFFALASGVVCSLSASCLFKSLMLF